MVSFTPQRGLLVTVTLVLMLKSISMIISECIKQQFVLRKDSKHDSLMSALEQDMPSIPFSQEYERSVLT